MNRTKIPRKKFILASPSAHLQAIKEAWRNEFARQCANVIFLAIISFKNEEKITLGYELDLLATNFA